MPRRPSPRPAVSPDASELRRVALDRIDVPPRRLRRDLGDVATLAISLDTYGQLAPVVCYEGADGRLRLIAGERRLEATRRLHAARVEAHAAKPGSVAEIDVLVRPLATGQDPAELELIENEQRRELTDVEEADAFIQLAREAQRTLQQLAEMSGRSIAYVSKRIRVFEDPRLREAVARGDLATSQAEELLALEESRRVELIQRSVTEGWTHDQMRDAVRALNARRTWGDDDPAAFRVETSPDPPGTERMELRMTRPSDLTRRIRELDAILSDLQPFQLEPRDKRALAGLARTLQGLARADTRSL